MDWSKNEASTRGGGIMIWANIIGDEVIAPFRLAEGVKLTSSMYCQFLKDALDPWLGDLPFVSAEEHLHA